MKKIFLIIPLLFLIFSCENKVEKVHNAFYYWKTDTYSEISVQEKNMLEQQNIEKLYVKYFEVDYTEAMGSFPVSKTNMRLSSYCEQSSPRKYTVIPTVYIKNIVFKKSSEKDLDKLADNVNFLINKFTNEKFDSIAVNEIQIDCDWTASTKDNYFYFLKKLKPISQKEISCTLRLYPYKYPDKMGVPPVDKVTLMCYNLINPLADDSKNSILDLKEMESYLSTKKKYPLHMDIALPLYSWMQLYQNNQFTGVLYNGNDLKKVLKETKPLWYEVTKDTVIDYKNYLRVGDKIKYEEITPEQVNKAIALIKKNIKLDKEITVSLFHLDTNQLNNYTDEEISHFYSDFTK
ncbi:MAG: hypothetical protein DI622_00655 [Chryseobacterium sp.]|uniref:hypothetical protein n=1 Tax=Chryseobacterium sp. TaxID=1871047 RepID=UPI000DB6018A|nr:hypothetical protein [Chryseobacterium sp.]MPS65538.1 hypothetical protein [Chryseobacterium sp.]PZU26527.1 MAG: hypothetical protein DI622_00655 [Chryseobacterium sp.]